MSAGPPATPTSATISDRTPTLSSSPVVERSSFLETELPELPCSPVLSTSTSEHSFGELEESARSAEQSSQTDIFTLNKDTQTTAGSCDKCSLLKLKVRRLQKQNSKLRTCNANMKLTIEELKHTVSIPELSPVVSRKSVIKFQQCRVYKNYQPFPSKLIK